MSSAVELESIVHIHSTIAIDRITGLTLEFVAIPSASLESRPTDIWGVADALELQILSEAPDPAASFLPHAIAAILLSSEAYEADDRFKLWMNTSPNTGLEIDPAVLNFASHCAFANFIGIEESPVTSKVLAAIVAAGGGVAVAVMTTIAAPVVVVIGAGVAAGAGTIIVFSAAAGVAERLYNKISG